MRRVVEFGCSDCGARYGEDVWAQLVLSERIHADEIRDLILGWPEEHVVEIRVCRCGQAIAARRTTECAHAQKNT
jgi:hypothetical protein